MGRIYLVRHGQTAWNKARIFRGRRDVRLNEQGRREAARSAQALRDVNFKCLYASPLSRARETAEIIAAGRDLEIIPDSAFTDIDYGEWTEYWDVEARRKFGDQYKLWEDSPHLMKFPGGESLEDVRRRSVSRLMGLAEQHAGEIIGVVSHRAVLKVLLCEAKGLDNSHFWKVPLDTCAISILDYAAGRLRVVAENDVAHVRTLAEHDSLDF